MCARRARGLSLLIVLVWAAVVCAQEDEGIVLPRQMGAINDYAAVLGSAREELQEQLNTIKQAFNVQLVILATIYDPYDNAALYAQRIWESWKLGKSTVLLVFVKEQTEHRWVFEIRLSEDMRERFLAEHLERLRGGLKYHLERRRIKTAIEESVKALRAMLEGSYGQPPPSVSAAGERPLWIWAVLGLLGLGGIALGVQVLLRSRCPRCGARMRSYQTYTRQGARVGYRSCPRCGYSRLR